MDMIDKLIIEFGRATVAHWSVAQNRDWLEYIKTLLLEKKVKNLLEIGTFKGVTTAFMSQFVNHIYTIDKNTIHSKGKIFPIDLWKFLGIKNITYKIMNSGSLEFKKFLKGISFDFVFIDGEHISPFPAIDFDTTKSCGRVLFHDYFKNNRFPGINLVVDKLSSVEINEPFAYWEETSDEKD